jgi:hypothetical protein
MTEVFLGNQASEFELKFRHVRDYCRTVRHEGRMSAQGLKTVILIKILYQLKFMLQKVWNQPPPPKKNK